ncbi:DNA polymerase III subunit delta [Sessilibacter corallicola]|uniref:DNA polymerase III subunit delta n=1 Tax=Sessilibacter corallicola TaxID=2904075 RepID=A0ABQ0AF83_9GAMM
MAKIRAEQLAGHCKNPLAPIYVIFGDEPLLRQEACDTLRKAATEQGYTERERYYSDASLDWDDVFSGAANFSLFAERKMVEIHLHNGKPGDKGAKAIMRYCEDPSEDTLLLITAPKLDGTSQRSKWFKALEAQGQIVQVWPVNAEQLPRWIDQRLKAKGLSASSEAIDMLSAKVEGNLLAAKQEIEKLTLISSQDRVISAEEMAAVVGDSARYDVFGLVDKALTGKTESAMKTLQGLKSEGTEPVIILWALAREIRTLVAICEAVESGQSQMQAFKAERVWDKRQGMMQAALARLSHKHLQHLLRKANGIDRAVKGLRKASVWDELTDLTLHLCGIVTIKPQIDALSLTT